MLLVIRVWKRWATLETGKVGDPNEPEIDRPDTEEEEATPTKLKLGFDVEVPDGPGPGS